MKKILDDGSLFPSSDQLFSFASQETVKALNRCNINEALRSSEVPYFLYFGIFLPPSFSFSLFPLTTRHQERNYVYILSGECNVRVCYFLLPIHHTTCISISNFLLSLLLIFIHLPTVNYSIVHFIIIFLNEFFKIKHAMMTRYTTF